LNSGDILLLVVLVGAVVLHEIAHGVAALAFGDTTARDAGRLSLNPIKHIDPVGSVLLPAMAVFAGAPAIGWAKPVPVNPSRLRDPRRDSLYVSLAGPATNFVLMAIAAFVAHATVWDGSLWTTWDTHDSVLFRVAYAAAVVNLGLGVFNLLPIPPLDGSALIERVLPRRWLPGWYQYQQYGLLVLFIAMFGFGILGIPSPFGWIMDPIFDRLYDYIFG
jgi:Zn-dependent protease